MWKWPLQSFINIVLSSAEKGLVLITATCDYNYKELLIDNLLLQI